MLSLGNNKFEYVLYPSKQGFKPYIKEVEIVKPDFSYKKVGARRLTVRFDDKMQAPQVQEYFLRLNYTGDVAMAFMNGTLVLDHFYHGAPWTIGLKRFSQQMKKEDLSFYFRPLRSDAPFLIDLPKEAIPDFSKGAVCTINHVEVVPEYITTIKF